MEGFYSREILQEKRGELESQRRILEGRKQEVANMVLAEEQRLVAVPSAKVLYDKIQKRLNTANYSTKKLAFDLFVEKILLSRTRADVWLRIPRGMAMTQASRMVLRDGAPREKIPSSASAQNLLRSKPYVECDVKNPDIWIQITFGIDLNLPAGFEKPDTHR